MDNFAYSYTSVNLYENFDSVHSEFFEKDEKLDAEETIEPEEKPIITFGYDSPPSLNNIHYLSWGNEICNSLLNREELYKFNFWDEMQLQKRRAIKSLRGKYKGKLTPSDEFAKNKSIEIELEA